MEYRIIKSPSQGALDILIRRKGSGRSGWAGEAGSENPALAGAVGLVQGRFIDMVVAADIAQKTVGVVVEDIKGSCPQNMILLALFGDTASVESAITEIKRRMEKGEGQC